jgi:2-polyprenyl-6-methoxyphenol hydroxylase-like FAD-dependent oxidoreductase
MDEHCDILIIGAGTAGVYFGWQMARRGHSVVIVERSERAAVGRRLDVFHIDSVNPNVAEIRRRFERRAGG